MAKFTDYLTAREAATLMGLSYDQLMRRARKGTIPSIRRGWAYYFHKDTVAQESGK